MSFRELLEYLGREFSSSFAHLDDVPRERSWLPREGSYLPKGDHERRGSNKIREEGGETEKGRTGWSATWNRKCVKTWRQVLPGVGMASNIGGTEAVV